MPSVLLMITCCLVTKHCIALMCAKRNDARGLLSASIPHNSSRLLLRHYGTSLDRKNQRYRLADLCNTWHLHRVHDLRLGVMRKEPRAKKLETLLCF